MFRVLQVDDEEMLLDLTSSFLTEVDGFSFRSVTSAGDALAALEGEAFDAIVSDYQMPGMDGIELLKAVRRADPEVPFILFTGKGREEVAMEALNNGATFYVQKGGDPSAQFGELAHKLNVSIKVHRSKVELAKSEGRLAQAQRLAHVGSWVLDLRDGTLDMSTEMFRICGVVPTAFDPRVDGFLSMLHPEDRPLFSEMLSAAGRGSTVNPTRLRLVWPNGEIRHLSLQLEPVLGVHRGVAEVAAAVSDITEAVRSEEALRESEVRLKYALEAVGDGVYDWDVVNGTVVVSERYREQLGYRARGGLLTHCEWSDLVHPDDRPRLARGLDGVLRGSTELYSTEYRMLAGDGGYRWVMDRGKVVARGKDGRPLKLIGTHVDITERRMAEEALGHSQEMHRQLVESMVDGVGIHDGKKIIFMNAAGARIFGYDGPEETVGLNPVEMVHPDSRELAKRRISGNRGEVQPWVQEKFLRKDGSSVDVEVITMPIVLRGSRAVQVVFRDLTERKAVEDRLRESEERYRALFEGSADAMLLINDTVVDCNTRAAEMFRTSRERLIGKRVADLSPPRQQGGLASEDRAKEVARVASAGASQQFEWNHRRADGEDFDAEVALRPVEIGGTPMMLAVIRDITERKLAEGRDRRLREEIALRNEELDRANRQLTSTATRLAESEARYRGLVELSQEGIGLLDDAGEVRFINPAFARIMKGEPSDFVGLNAVDLVTPSHRREVVDAISRLVLGETVRLEFEMLDRQGGLVPVEAQGAPLHDAAGEFQGAVVVGTDLTMRKAMESALKDANSKLKILGSITRHDLLNQLAIIEGSANLLARGHATEAQGRHIERMLRAIDNMEKVIRFTKDYEGMGTVEPRWQSPGAILTAQLSRFDLTGVSLSCGVDGVEVYADPMLEKVFYNLIDNSLRHGGDVRKIGLSSARDGNDLLIVYEDDGRGVPADQKDRIFEMGYGSNTGLGLFLSRAVLGMTGLTITEDGATGRGARFVIRVPADRHRAAEGAPR